MNGNGGNNLALQLVMDGLKLQGTNPSFLAGRDAILAAEVALTGGENQNEIWTAFARRGMGFSASDGGGAGSITVTEAFDVPGRITGTVFRDDDASGAQGAAEPGLAGWTVYLDQNNNGVADLATMATFNSTDTPKPIPDGPKTLFTRAVSGLPGVITDINVKVNLTHPSVGELYLTLISPGNTPVILANYLGGSGDNFTNTVFDDEAATRISTAAAPFTGSFKPYFDLAQLDGRDPNGTWTLRLDDSVNGNTGTLLNWSMEISYGDPDPMAVTDANGHYSFFGLGNGTHHVRSTLPPGFTQTTAKVTILPLAAQQATAKPTLQWNPLTGAVRYDMWLSNLTTGQSQYVRDQNMSGTSWTPSTDMPLGRYRVWIRGIDAAGISAQCSTSVDFTVMPAPIATSPLLPRFDRRPAFTWNAVAGAVSYELSLRNQTTGAYVYQQKNIATVNWTPPVDLPDGPYRWWVQATGAGGVLSFWSPSVDFNVGGRTKLLTPVGGTQQAAPTFTWQAVDGAVRFDLWVDRIGGQTQVIRQTNLIGTQYIPTPALAPGYYRAWIRAVSSSGEPSVWSTPIEFKVAGVTLPKSIQSESLHRLVTLGSLEVLD